MIFPFLVSETSCFHASDPHIPDLWSSSLCLSTPSSLLSLEVFVLPPTSWVLFQAHLLGTAGSFP
ncbi:hypothetical protein L208DRAFT_1417723, partial [Tricholoma matsutake]